ncbi:MAG: hypothetical protein CMB53_00345 [Euryarchaeota archaeon]|nr:hypothetical protein [Euryarchaeota archaeon]|tara:strand:- start:366 stop:671 length:306 start_codon:yes stop_codon:yes gene_type:complete
MSNDWEGKFSIGTEFQKLVWRELLEIPYGETRSYKEIADSIGKPSSSRAVANACSSNPYAPDIPCHRVIRSDGKLGGYSGPGGSLRKMELLESEGVNLDFK